MSIKTVVVVGAGASVPYDLPTSETLKTKILTHCDSYPDSIARVFESRARRLCTIDTIAKFRKQFQRSTTQSIDAFLEQNASWSDLGKMLIATIISPLERKAIFDSLVCGDWLSWLFNSVNDPVRLLENKDISIITFNYDRLIEASLYHILRNQFGYLHDQAWKTISNIHIVHVYGAFADDLAAELEADMPVQELSQDARHVEAWHASQGIKIMPEDRDTEDADLKLCQKRIEAAEAVIVLGFGFNKLNMRRIGLIDACSRNQRYIFASACKLRSSEKDLARRLLGGGGRIMVGESADGCHDFLRDKCANWIHETYNDVS